MTNRKNKLSYNQPSIFDWLKKVEDMTRQTASTTPNPNLPNGSLDIDSEFRAAVSQDIKHAKDSTGREFSRYEIAARMSELTGVEITKTMLDNWTAECHEKHRFPCQFLPAFVIATGGQRRAVEVISKHSGLFLLPGPDALRAEIQRLDEEEKRIKAEKIKRKIFLKEIEG